MKLLALLPLLFLPLDAQTAVPETAVAKPQVKQNVHKTPKAGDTVIVNGASFTTGISPGSIATIFGSGLTSSGNGVIGATTSPLPLQLGGTRVYINGISAPLYAVASTNGSDQINLQVPYEVATDHPATVQITDFGQTVSTFQADVFLDDPGIFTFGSNQGLFVRNSDYTLVTPDDPANIGDYLFFYATGLGLATNEPATGYDPGSNPLSYVKGTVEVDIAGQSIPVNFAGLAPGIPGVYQVNVQLPHSLPAGDLPAVIIVNGQVSRTVNIRVR